MSSPDFPTRHQRGFAVRSLDVTQAKVLGAQQQDRDAHRLGRRGRLGRGLRGSVGWICSFVWKIRGKASGLWFSPWNSNCWNIQKQTDPLVNLFLMNIWSFNNTPKMTRVYLPRTVWAISWVKNSRVLQTSRPKWGPRHALQAGQPLFPLGQTHEGHEWPKPSRSHYMNDDKSYV